MARLERERPHPTPGARPYVIGEAYGPQRAQHLRAQDAQVRRDNPDLRLAIVETENGEGARRQFDIVATDCPEVSLTSLQQNRAAYDGSDAVEDAMEAAPESFGIAVRLLVVCPAG